MSRIPFLELKPQVAELREELDEAMARVVDSGWFVLGPEVEAFEEEFARYCGAKHCVSLGSGLDALVFSLRALGVGDGDEVIVPAHTFVATWLAVSQCGATPIGVDIDPATANLDLVKAAEAITSKTKALIPVHLYGQPADIPGFLELGEKHSIPVLFDAAQAHGALHNGERIGGEGAANAWSFYPGKNLGAFGDGGAVTTNDAQLADKLRMLRNYGSKEKYVHDIQGGNSRLDPLQAAVLRVKLAHLDSWNERRRTLAAAYHSALSSIEGIKRLTQDPRFESSWHLYVIHCSDRAAAIRRLEDRDIGHLIHYPIPCHRQGAYAGSNHLRFEHAERAAEQVLSLPMSPHHDHDVATKVADALR
ncbi:MAG: dTDP-4-amino-4,6-dideoxygalactose transaminase [Polyangiales bacterium]|jgi:dTDP-4-amino-4,6-dideoxygalactose transaminase